MQVADNGDWFLQSPLQPRFTRVLPECEPLERFAASRKVKLLFLDRACWEQRRT
jgi:hypothetical protein